MTVRARRQPTANELTPRSGRRSRVVLGVLVALLTAAPAAACGAPATPSPVSPPAATDGPRSQAPAPRSTPWAGNAVLGIERLGAADAEIRKGINDFTAGVQTSDPDLMLRAATGLAGVDVLLEDADRVAIYEPMRPFAEAYRAAIEAMSGAARDLEAALEAGDTAAVPTASRELIASFTAYSEVQAELAGYVNQIPEQKRLLLR
ncbi:MAG TPA: hypothetical protein VM344_11020 [Vitreimonas sp.]|nr:hypothetical protein [Vitreimonas sp.]